ncbi:MAG TPA: hypothetical protein VKN74_00420 [Candidatus Mcinerneyibacterium sp.]|nr:hypothetical protein [Candidatus Mcinerneyibacterium sp.]
MNKILVFLSFVIIFSNTILLKNIKKDIINKKEKIEKLEKQNFEYSYINENGKVQKILNNNKVLKKYTYLEASKEILKYFQIREVTLKNADFKKEGDNKIQIKLELVADYFLITKLIRQIENSQGIIIIKDVQFKKIRNNIFSWKIVLIRIFNI